MEGSASAHESMLETKENFAFAVGWNHRIFMAALAHTAPSQPPYVLTIFRRKLVEMFYDNSSLMQTFHTRDFRVKRH